MVTGKDGNPLNLSAARSNVAAASEREEADVIQGASERQTVTLT